MNNSVVLLLRYGWASPNTLLGLLFVPLALLSGGSVQRKQGVLEIHGGAVRWFLRHCTLLPNGASGMTLGHVILGTDLQILDLIRPHEQVHVRQYERWGPFFLPAYLLSSATALIRGKNPYLDNRFEIEAYHRIL